MAASVSTLVVSWNDAADRNESVAKRGLGDAQQQRLAHRRVLALGDELVGNVLELEAVDLAARQEVGVAGVEHGHLAQHLARDDLDVLVVDVNALGHVHVLNLSRRCSAAWCSGR